MGIGDHQLDTIEAAGHQVIKKRLPGGLVFTDKHVQSQKLSASIGVDAGSRDGGHIHDPSAFSGDRCLMASTHRC